MLWVCAMLKKAGQEVKHRSAHPTDQASLPTNLAVPQIGRKSRIKRHALESYCRTHQVCVGAWHDPVSHRRPSPLGSAHQSKDTDASLISICYDSCYNHCAITTWAVLQAQCCASALADLCDERD